MRFETLYKRNSNPNLFADKEQDTNCGSFALNVTEWYTPYVFEPKEEELWKYDEDERAQWVYDMLQDGYTIDEVMDCLIERDFEFVLKTCPWLEPIEEEEIYDGGRVIAYRLSLQVPDDISEFDMDEDGDFHFRVLIDGEWWEKNGAGPVKRVEDPDVWEVDDWLVYSGPIRYARFRDEEI